ncbi:unnamed protein product [Effrenium voratum]|nr:unnamed protein product [Effrenium voratum]
MAAVQPTRSLSLAWPKCHWEFSMKATHANTCANMKPGRCCRHWACAIVCLHTKRRTCGRASFQELRNFEAALSAEGAELPGLRAADMPQSSAARGVFATRSFEEGELVLRIPQRLCLQVPLTPTSEERWPWQPPAPDEALQPVAALARRLLECRRGGSLPQGSAFRRYLDLLPGLPALHPLRGWDVKLCGTLRHLHAEAKRRFTSCPASRAEFSDSDFRWALGMVWTRAFALRDSLSLVPYLDLFNHWIPQNRDDPLWSCRLQEFDNAVGLVADRRIMAGEELNHLYSEASDAQLLVQHGIPPKVPSANPFNEALVLLGSEVLESDSPELCQARRAALGKLGWQPACTEWPFLVPSDAQEAGSLRTLASLLVMDVDLLQAVAIGGAIQLTASQRRQSCKLLSKWLKEAQDDLEASFEFEALSAARRWSRMLAEALHFTARHLRRGCSRLAPSLWASTGPCALEAAALAMADQMRSQGVYPAGRQDVEDLQRVLTEQKQLEIELEQELHAARLQQRRLTTQLSEAQARRRQTQQQARASQSMALPAKELQDLAQVRRNRGSTPQSRRTSKGQKRTPRKSRESPTLGRVALQAAW